MVHLEKLTSVIIVLYLASHTSCTVEEKKNAPKKLVEVPLTKINNNYYGDIVVGTPHTEGHDKIFRVNFDTGSQHLWLMSTERCPTPECEEVKFTPYDGSKSTTCVKTEIPFDLGYADGTVVSGTLGWDYVQLGEGEASVRINQTIGFASEVKGIIEDCDGIFGLGLLSESLFPGKPDPPMWTLNKKYGMDEFGIYLGRVLKGPGAGKLIFGGHDESLIEGPLQWHDVVLVRNKFDGYKIQIDKIIVQKGERNSIEEQIDVEINLDDMLALPDSGNNVIVGPKKMFDGIRNAIMKHATFVYSNAYSFWCSENIDELPNVIFVMDGREYIMYPKDYIWTLKSGKVCKIGIFGMEMENDHIVLGQIFMQTYYTKFNVIQQEVGFARAKHPK